MSLIVSADERKPVMAFTDHKDRKLVLFENGTLYHMSESEENDDLRGDSVYAPIYSNLSQIKSRPIFSKNEGKDWGTLLKQYKISIIISYIIVLSLASLPFIFHKTLIVLLSDVLNIELDGWMKFVIGIIASTFAMSPEIWIRSRVNDEAMTLELEKTVTLRSIGDFRKVHNPESSLTNHLAYSFAALFKGFLSFLIFFDFTTSIVLIISSPILILLILVTKKVIKPKLIDNAIEIPEVQLSEIFEYICNAWSKTNLMGILQLGETESIEFKSSLWFDYHKAIETEESLKKNRYDPDYNPNNKDDMTRMAYNVVKGVCGLLNANKTGKLLIGVDDNAEVIGLKNDFEILSNSTNLRDDFGTKLDSILRKHLKTSGSLHDLWKFEWHEHGEKEVCVISVNKTSNGIYCEYQGKQTFYLRRTAKTEPVTGVELAKELKRFS